MNFLSLFSGIGGLDLGLEWAGWTCAAMCESEPWCRALLAERFPGVPLFDDVRTIEATAGQYDAVVGGFPCQDISSAGKGVGIEGERSGLWKEMHRVIASVRPRWVVAENVPALRTRGADRVLGDLEGEGYTCWPLVVGADDIRAPHRRKRVFILARMADCKRSGCEGAVQDSAAQRWEDEGRSVTGCCGALADPSNTDRRRRIGQAKEGTGSDVRGRRGSSIERGAVFPPGPADLDAWRMVLELHPELAPAQTESVVCRMADGLPERLGRRWRRRALKGLGNAVVPQVGQLIGETINRFEAAKAGNS